MNVVISDTAEYGCYLFDQAARPLLKDFVAKLGADVIGEGISSNFVLSDKDKEWLEKMYPKDNQIEITVYFVDSDSPSWKKAWIKKVVTEQISPHVGIKFNFSKELKPLAPGETYPPPTMEPLTPLSTTSIFVIMLISFILFTILVYYVR